MTCGRNQFVARVSANVALCREHYRLVLSMAEFPATLPGHFIQIRCCEARGVAPELMEREWEPSRATDRVGSEFAAPSAMLARPFSLAGRRDLSHAVELDIIHRVVGVGTDWLSRLKVGEAVDILGPLGNTFPLPQPGSTALMVGGGVGIPPMIYLAERLARQPAVAFAGALRRDLLPLTVTGDYASRDSAAPLGHIEEFARHGIGAVIATDDGSLGFGGFVTQALERYLEENPREENGYTIYTCGPEPMMRRVAEIALRRGMVCHVAVERAMACGMGTCQSCCIRVKKADSRATPLPGSEWCYRLACTDGPIFAASDLLW